MSLTSLHRTWIVLPALLVCLGCGKGGHPVFMQPPTVKRTVVVQPPPVVTVTEEPAPLDAARDDLVDQGGPALLLEPPVGEPAPLEPVAKPLEPAPQPVEPGAILHTDSFADVAGSIHLNKNGMKTTEGSPNLRTVYFFAAKPEGGSFTMQVFEDNTTHGPDGKPGVLSLSWLEVPPKLDWSGFVYLGRTGAMRGLALPQIKQVRTVDDLAGMRLKFRYRGINPNNPDGDKPVKLTIGCRFEPGLDDSFNKRLDFGKLEATDEWSTFEIALQDGKNMPAFLRMLADENPPHFKIVFAQEGPILGYHPGDTLLIDDITLSVDEPNSASGGR